MAKKAGKFFDAKAFLSTVDGARAYPTAGRRKLSLSQAELADSVFLHPQGQVFTSTRAR